jgi:hypothetical protein
MARFCNSNGYVVVDSAHSWTEAVVFSLSFWMKCVSQGVAQNVCPYSEGLSTSNNPFLFIENGSSGGLNKIFLTLRANGGGSTNKINTNTTATFFDDTWHNFIYTQDGGSPNVAYAVYADGVLDINGTYAPLTTTIDRATIGAFRGNTLQKIFPGSIMEVAKWSRVLSSAEAKLLASGVPASHLAPTHYWPLWGIDSPEPDIGSGVHVPGVLTNTSFVGGGKVLSDLLVLG